MVDELQIIQVILNILTNAEQAIESRQGPGEITIAIRPVKGMIRISISDDGPGIPPEHLRNIFDPFFTTKEVGQGTGLGLSICYGIIREHGGELWVESTPGDGTTFQIELPVLAEVTPERTHSTATNGSPAAGHWILVVDDEPAMRDVLLRALSTHGNVVAFAPDGERAWKLIQGNQYDVIFLDLRMPGVDGRELYGLITKLSPELAKKVVFITGDTASADTRRFLESTASPVLSKPFTIEAIRQLLQPLTTNI